MKWQTPHPPASVDQHTMAGGDTPQPSSAAQELCSHTRESLASLSHAELLDTAVALAARCRVLEEARVGKPYISSLPDELLTRVLLALPVVSRLRCCAVSRRFKQLLHTPALCAELRAAVDPAHVLLSGRTLGCGQDKTSPDGRFVLVYQTDANFVLYYDRSAPQRLHLQPVWALQTVGCHIFYTHRAGRLELSRAGQVCVLNDRGHCYWQAPAPHGQPPYRLVVRNQGDFAVVDANDVAVWAAVPQVRPWEA